MPIQKRLGSGRSVLFACSLLASLLVGCSVANLNAVNSVSKKSKAGSARALIKVSLSGAPESDDENADSQSYETYKKTQSQLVTVPFVIRAALRPPQIQRLKTLKDKNPVSWLEQNIKVEYLDGSEILEVSLACAKCENAKEAKVLVDAVVDAYLDEAAQTVRSELAQNLDLLRSEHRKMARAYLELTEEEKKAKENNMPFPEKRRLQAEVAHEQVKTLAQRALDAELEIRKKPPIRLMQRADVVSKK